jgi:hypothetical protein
MKSIVFLKNPIIIMIYFAIISSVTLFKIEKNKKEKCAENLKGLRNKKTSNIKKNKAFKNRYQFEATNGTASNNTMKLSDKVNDILKNTFHMHNKKSEKKSIIDLRSLTWNFKLTSTEVKDIIKDMNFEDMKGVSERSLRSFKHNFILPFEICDDNHNNLLDLEEFKKCLKKDEYLNRIYIANNTFPIQGSVIEYNNFTEYAKMLFDIFDDRKMGNLNFHNYMSIRLMTFSWMRCSTASPFIEEVNFECAIDVIAGSKSLVGNQAKALYDNGLQFFGSLNRKMDFIIFCHLATSVRLYGKINKNEGTNINLKELTLALDNNILPERYNKKTIKYLMKLTHTNGHGKDNGNEHEVGFGDTGYSGIDLISFCFYDFWLKVFDYNTKKNRFLMDLDEFIVAYNYTLFPKNMRDAIRLIPQNNVTSASYDMYVDTYLDDVGTEENHFLKSFLQNNELKKIKEEKKYKKENKKENKNFNGYNKENWSLEQARGNNTNFTFNQNKTLNYIFNILDGDMKGEINFYDFGSYIQLLYFFNKNDPNNSKGRITVFHLEKEINELKGYPIISKVFSVRAKRLKSLNQNLYMDFASFLIMMRIDDIMKIHLRDSDKTQLSEIELKNILFHINRKFIPDSHLKDCLRKSSNKDVLIKVFDWECVIVKTEASTLKFYEISFDYLTSVTRHLNLNHTVFQNKDLGLP